MRYADSFVFASVQRLLGNQVRVCVRRVALLVIAFLAVSCNTRPDSGLRVTVTIRSQGSTQVRADCLRLAVLSDSKELKAVTVVRPAGDTAVFGVVRGPQTPANVTLQAAGYLGDCNDESTLKLNARSQLVTATFPEEGIAVAEITVDPPGTDLDADRDGYVSSAFDGPDCGDNDSTVFPGSVQVCSNTEDTDCDGQPGCDDSECGTAVVCANPPDRVAFGVPIPFSMERYECRGPFKVELHNSSGVRAAIRRTAMAFSSSLPGVTFHEVASCADTPLSSYTVPYGSPSFEVYLRADENAYGKAALKVTGDRVARAGEAEVEVHPLRIQSLAFTSPQRTLTAGECSAEQVTLEFRDEMNRHTDVDVPTTITMGSAPGDIGNANVFFSDANCTVASSMVPLVQGQGTVTLHLKVKKAGSFSLTATASSGQTATQSLVVHPEAPNQLAFTNSPLALAASQFCSLGALQVQLRDVHSNPVTAPNDITVRFTANGLNNVEFFDSADCSSSPRADFTIAAGSDSISVRVRAASVSGTGEVKASAIGGPALTEAKQPLRVTAGFASSSAVRGAAQTTTAGVCTATPFVIQLEDNVENPTSSAEDVTFTLYAVIPGIDPTFKFFSGSGCASELSDGKLTVPKGQTSAEFFFRGTKATSSFDVRARSVLGEAKFIVGNSINPGAPAKLVFGSPLQQYVKAGACTTNPFSVEVRDAYDNVSSFPSEQTVTVASTPGGVTIGPQSACASSDSMRLPAGASQVGFSARHAVASTSDYRLTATVGTFSTANHALLNVTPNDASLIIEDPPGPTKELTAGQCQIVRLARRDALGNPSKTTSAVTVTFPQDKQWTVYPTTNCTGVAGIPFMNDTETVAFSVKPRTAGIQQMVVSIGSDNTLQTAVRDFNIVPAFPSLVFEVPNTGSMTATADQIAGGCTEVRVARKDAFLNDAPLGTATKITVALPVGATAHSGTPCIEANKLFNASLSVAATDARATFFVRGTKSPAIGDPPTQTVTPSWDTLSAALSLTVKPGAPKLSVSVPTGTKPAGQCLQVTVERLDDFENLVPLATAKDLTLTAAPDVTISSTQNCPNAGSTSISVAANSSRVTFHINANTATPSPQTLTFGLDGQSTSMTLQVNPAASAQLTIDSLPAVVGVEVCTGPIRVRRRDTWNNLVTAEPALNVSLEPTNFQLYSNVGCSTSLGTVTIPMGDFQSNDFYAKSSDIGLANVKATAGSLVGNAPSTIVAGPASQLAFLNVSGSFVTDECSSSQLEIEARDSSGHQVTPAMNQLIVVTLTASSSLFYNSNSCMGLSTTTINLTKDSPSKKFTFKSTVSGPETITVSSPGLTAASQIWTSPSGLVSRLSWKSVPPSSPSRFICTSAGAVQAHDNQNNVIAVSSRLIVNLSASKAGVTLYSDSNCTSAVTSAPIEVGQSETSALYLFATNDGSTTLSAAANGVGTAAVQSVTPVGAKGTLTATPASLDIEAGSCVAMTVERSGPNGVISQGTTDISASVPNGSPMTVHALADCTDVATTALVRTIAHGQTATTVYLRGRSANAPVNPLEVTLTSSDPNGGSSSKTTLFKAYPLVRRGSCDLGDQQDRVSCPLTPQVPQGDISRSFLVFTSTGTGGVNPNATNQAVECHLDSTNGNANVVCSRAGKKDIMSVNYQVVSWGRDFASGFGMTVQHIQTSTVVTSSLVSIAPVSRSQSFVLASVSRVGANDGISFPVVRLKNSSQLEVVANPFISAEELVLSIQVVSFAGAAVVHSDWANVVTSGNSATLTSSTLPNTFVLGMAQLLTNTSDVSLMCKRRFRMRVPNDTQIALSRGADAVDVCEQDDITLLTTARVSLPNAVVSSHNVTLSGTASTGSASVGPFIADKTIAFMGMQGQGGQTAGEGAFAGLSSADDDTGSFHGLVSFNSNNDGLIVQRTPPASAATSIFTVFVVKFDP